MRLARRLITAAGLFSLGVNVLMLTIPLYMLQIFDRVLSSRSVETLVMLSLIAAVALLTLGALDVVRSLVLGRLGALAERKLGGHVIGASVIDCLGSGRASAQGLRDLATVRGFLSGPGIVPLLDAPWIPVFLVVVFLLHPWLGAVASVGALLLTAAA